MNVIRDLVPLIARHASIETRMRMACVCKRWYDMVNYNIEVWHDEYILYTNAQLHRLSKWLHEIKSLPKFVRKLQAYQATMLWSIHIQPTAFQKYLLAGKNLYIPYSPCFESYYIIQFHNGRFHGYFTRWTLSIPEALMVLDQACHFKLDLFG